jgi:hypothetical protein
LPPVATPAHRTEYYTGSVPWSSKVAEKAAPDGDSVLDLAQKQAPGYQAGGHYQERWDGAVFNVTLMPVDVGASVLVRQDNTLYANFSGYTDGDGHVGAPPYTLEGKDLALYRGDTLLGEFTGLFGSFGYWDVAAEPTTYQLRYTVDLPDPYRVSRRMESVWNFTTSADQQGEPPLTSIGFRPDLALDNSARAGSVLSIPLTFAQQSTAGKVRSAKVWVSFDEGTTWSAVPTDQHNGAYTATVRHPKDSAGFVSLRATAVDTDGNTVTTTVYRAYEVK